MRIAIASRIYRPEPSAASLFLGSVADALIQQGHQVEVFTAKPVATDSNGSRGERIRTFPVLRDRSGYVRGYAQYMSFDLPLAFRLLFAPRPAVVFVEPPPTTGAIVRVVCALRRIPYVYDAADIWSDAARHATSSKLVLQALRTMETFALNGASALVTISQGVVDRARALGVRAPISITGFGADTSVFRYSAAPIQRVFIYAGTYTQLHGAEILIEAFAQFCETHPGYRLLFIGNGAGQDEMRDQAKRLGVNEALEFRDSVPSEDLQPLLASSVASLATLHPERGYAYAFTSKIYSSLAAGCPVIFSGTGPTEEFMENAARRVPVGASARYDASSIAQAMRNASDHPLTPAERLRLAEWAAAEHSMQSVAREVAEVITETARAKRGSS